MTLRAILIFSILCIFKSSVSAQVDIEFWFAAPEVTAMHADRPVFLRISSLQQATSITITQPANPSFTPIQKSLSANSTLSIDLTSKIDVLENKPPNQVLNYGILITSSSPITAYYEVLGSAGNSIGVNSDIFVLKGNHALGNEFYIPFQTHWDNNPSVDGWSSFDIVATEDNTTVTITPTQDIVGHTAGVSYNIVLQKGQTYSARATSTLGIKHATGSHITADKPIAVTTKDDSIQEGSNYDLAGDQIIPLQYIGKEYIAIKVSDASNTDRLYIVATMPNTTISLDGSVVATLNAGQAFEYQILSATTYITSSDPVYVWHVAGFSQELGGAILPPIACTGSRQVSFTRSTDEPFYLAILIKTGHEQYFTLNGNASLIPATAFTTVANTGGAWKYAKIPFTYAVIPANSPNLIKNDSADFHMATLNGASNTGFRYGYFSDFGFLELGANKNICEGDNITLDAGFFQDSYNWNTGATGQYITVNTAGLYTVTVTKGLCHSTDSVRIGYYPKITTQVLGNDTAACANSGLSISTLYPYFSYLWNTGSTGGTISPISTGYYSVLVKNEYGCKKSDTLHVLLYPTPLPKIVYNTDLESFCKDSIVTLQSDKDFPKYNWDNGDTTKEITTVHNENDSFTLLVVDSNGCQNLANLTLDCSPIIGLIPNLMTPNGDGKNDIFYIEYLRPNKWIFEVYNRWGDRVYLNTKYDNSFDAKNLNDGLYYFSLRHVEGKGENKSWLQIIR
jgi:gliding motility-associated-like protein